MIFLEASPGVASDSFPFQLTCLAGLSRTTSAQNLVEHQLVGDLLVPLSCCVLANGSISEIITATQYKLHYVPVNQPHTNTGSTEINTNENKYILFHSGKELHLPSWKVLIF